MSYSETDKKGSEYRPLSKGWGGLKILEECQHCLLFCQRTLTAGGPSRMEGLEVQNTKQNGLRERDRQRGEGVKDFGEMSSVSIVVLSEPRQGRIVARNKRTPNADPLCFSAIPVYMTE